jgi:hypothetical protein
MSQNFKSKFLRSDIFFWIILGQQQIESRMKGFKLTESRYVWVPKEIAKPLEKELSECFRYIGTQYPNLGKYRGETESSLLALKFPFRRAIVAIAIEALLQLTANKRECLFGPHLQQCRCYKCTDFLQIANNVVETMHSNLKKWHQEQGYHHAYSPPSKTSKAGDEEKESKDAGNVENDNDNKDDDYNDDGEWFGCCESSDTGCSVCGGCHRGHCVCKFYPEEEEPIYYSDDDDHENDTTINGGESGANHNGESDIIITR